MPAQTPSAATPMTPVTPTIPSFGGGGIPGGGAMPGLAMPGGFPLSGPLRGSDDELSPRELDDALLKAGDADDEPSADPHGDEQVDRRDAEPTVPAAGQRPSRCPTAKPSPQPILTRSGHQGRSGWHTHRRCFPPGGDQHSASGDRGERPGRPVAAHTRGYRHAHGSPRACPRRKPGPAQRPDPAHFHRERAQLPRPGEHPPGLVTAAAPDTTDPPAPTRPATA